MIICSLWRPPSPPELKSSVKSDPCAHSRSSIRRRGAGRHVASQSSSNSLSPRSSLAAAQLNDALQQLDHLLENPPIRQSTVFGDVALVDSTRDALSESAARREEGSRLLRDALRHRQPGRRLRIPRESSLRFEMPTPPWSPSEALQRSTLGDYARIRQAAEGFPYSPRFAPAFGPRHDNSGPSARTDTRSPPPAVARPPVHMTEDGPAPGVRYLRRVGHRSVGDNNGTASSQQGIDGLGDRQRSASPDGDDDLGNAWETLLTTLTPDPNLPSAESSFTSNAATNSSRAAESGRRSQSSQTQQTPSGPTATVHMILEPYPDFFNPCDIPDHATDSDTETESELGLSRSASSRQRQRPRSRLLESTSAIGSTQDSQPPVPRLPRSLGLPSISLISHDPSSGVDMQAIVDRLAQREHVPDDWWAAAGLPRTMGRQLDVGDGSSEHVNDGRTNAADES